MMVPVLVEPPAATQGRRPPAPSPTTAGVDSQALSRVVLEHWPARLPHYRAGWLDERLRRAAARIAAPRRSDAPAAGNGEHLPSGGTDWSALRRHLFVGAPRFFRDASEWQALELLLSNALLPQQGLRPLRAWVVGCGAGHDAYSLAMLLDEAMPAHARFTVFATDLDAIAIERARKGCFGATDIQRLGRPRAARHFHADGDGWRIAKRVRDRIVFARHDVLADPPFIDLDLVCCRNVLMLLSPEGRGLALDRFAFGLRSGGTLFLGRREGVTERPDTFAPVADAARLYRRAPRVAPPARVPLRDWPPADAIPVGDGLDAREVRAASGVGEAGAAGSGASSVADTDDPDLLASLTRDNDDLRDANQLAISAHEELRSQHDELLVSKQEIDGLNAHLARANAELERRIAELGVAYADLDALVASTDIATLFLDTNLAIRHYTPALLPLLPAQHCDIGRRFTDLKLGVIDPVLPDCAAAALLDAQVSQSEVPSSDGTRWYQRRVAPYRNAANRVAGVIVTFHDISARRRHEAGLLQINHQLEARVAERTSELERAMRVADDRRRLLQGMLDSTAEGFVVVDRADRLVLANPAARRLLGAATDPPASRWVDAYGVRDLQLRRFAPDESPTQRATRGQLVRGVEVRMGGGETVVEVSASPLEGGAGEAAVVASLRDVTAERRAFEAQARLTALMRSTRAAFVSWLPDGTIVDWNEGAAALFGYTSDAVNGMPIERLFAPPELPRFERIVRDAVRTGIGDGTVPTHHRQGHVLDVAWLVATVRGGHGGLNGLSAIGVDVSERARLERRIARLADEQRQDIGRDLHDTLGQQLSAIAMLASALSSQLKDDDAALMGRLEDAVESAKRQLRATLKGLAAADVEGSGLRFALEELAESTRSLHGIVCQVAVTGTADELDPSVATQLYLVAREAVHNAVKHAAPARIWIELRLDDAPLLRVTDDGNGCPPFGNGDGMGLQIMDYRSAMIGGDLAIEPGPNGCGTVVRCRLAPREPGGRSANGGSASPQSR